MKKVVNTLGKIPMAVTISMAMILLGGWGGIYVTEPFMEDLFVAVEKTSQGEEVGGDIKNAALRIQVVSIARLLLVGGGGLILAREFYKTRK